jgi:hypothetical protein
MNLDTMPADQVETNQWQAMLPGWRTLLAWEIVVTVLTVVMARQHLGLALAAVVVDVAAVAQTQRVANTRWSSSSVDDPRPRASVTSGWAPPHSSFLSAR